MKKFLFLTIAVFLVLVVSMALYTPVAKADSPAEFVVGITRRSNTGVETPVLNAIVTARVVRKGVYLNRPGWPYKQLPLASYPNGSHLDSDDSGTPDTNDEALFPTISWYQWGLASKNDYIWCGAAGGVQEGQFEVDVDIADGRWPPYLGQGHWEYQWFEKYGGATYVASGVQQGTKARVQAVNPRQTSVWFTFVEDPPPSPPPPPEPDPKVGSITIAKRGYFEAGELSELKIGETLQRGQVLISPDRSKKLVMQEDGNLAVYIYHGPIWQAAVQGSNRLAFQSDGNLALWKDNADGTATALWSSGSSGALGTVLRMQDDGNLVMYNGAYNGAPAVWYSRMQKYWNGTNTFFAEYAGGTSAPVNSGDYLFNSLANTNSHLATSNEVATAQVLVSNAYPLTGTSVFHSSQANPSTVNGVWMYPDYYATGGTQQPYWTTVQVPAGKQFVKAQICINGKCSDNTSTVICTGANKTGTCTLPGLTVLNGTTTYVDWWMAPIPVAIQYYPWLQTKNGDVTSGDYQNVKGKIIGQKIGSATDLNNRRGARRAGTGTAAATVAESSFVVAATDAGDYFCAQERFVLGKSLADRDNFDDGSCKTGGYAPSPVNFDKVKASIAKAYADNGNGVLVPAPGNRCAPKYATSAVATAASLSATLGLGCPTGGIQKIGVQADTVTLSSALTVNGRGTLWIPGNLTIDQNITYGAATNDPKTTPNLVIFVEGSVYIGADVTRIDASIISMETISTCKEPVIPGPACSKALTINGFLASDGPINFARRYYAEPYTTATPSPAELINLTSQSTTFPAPGLDRTDIDVTSKLQINGGEFAPRLN